MCTDAKYQYANYLKSEHWKEFKIKKQINTLKRCSICASTIYVELHHFFYTYPWDNVKLSDTRWLCRKCHQCAHELIALNQLTFLKPNNHQSCFAILKFAVKKTRGFGNKNLFYPQSDELM